MNSSVLTGIFTLLIGLVYTIFALLLPQASLGRPAEPKIFPLALGILMIGFSAALLFKEGREPAKAPKKETSAPFFSKNIQKIVLTCLFSIIYAFLFARAGYVISTIIFLESELFLFNGIKKWKTNTLVAVIYSLVIYVLFSKILGVYLPMTPGIGI